MRQYHPLRGIIIGDLENLSLRNRHTETKKNLSLRKKHTETKKNRSQLTCPLTVFLLKAMGLSPADVATSLGKAFLWCRLKVSLGFKH